MTDTPTDWATTTVEDLVPEPVDTPDDWSTTTVDDLVPEAEPAPEADDWGDVAL